jgi:hypothetical protein
LGGQRCLEAFDDRIGRHWEIAWKVKVFEIKGDISEIAMAIKL